MQRLIHNGNAYVFARLPESGEGAWSLNNVIVSLDLHAELTSTAREKKLSEPHNFNRFPPKPEPAITVSSGSSRKTLAGNGRFAVRIKL